MTRLRFLVGLALLVALAALALWLWQHPGPQSVPIPVRHLASIDAELFDLDASAITRKGAPTVKVLRFGSTMRFVPHHYRTAGLAAPQTIDAWADELQAPVVLNAGQFDDKLEYLGWLKANGVWLNDARKTQWKALLVSDPVVGPAYAGVIDLEHANPNIADGFRHVVQSMMLLDEAARVRVRESDLLANRTVVAQDRDGRMLVMLTEGAVTLAALARWLPDTDLALVRAMNLDGGIESQLAIRVPEVELSLYGQHGTGTTGFAASPGEVRYPIPAVIAVEPARPVRGSP
ncbi:MAG: phosphodiester glycosidase family protein [Deltaproteobacteria bacterium]|nr:phosphodiester glycosidase family protein [Deltaproteobacteria bacterium]